MYKGEKKLNTAIRDLGEEDLAAIISEAKLPVVVCFVSDWCESCEKYMSEMMGLSCKYKNNIDFIMVNIDENIYVAKEFNISAAPVVQIYRDGALVDKIEVYESKLLSKKVAVLSPLQK